MNTSLAFSIPAFNLRIPKLHLPALKLSAIIRKQVKPPFNFHFPGLDFKVEVLEDDNQKSWKTPKTFSLSRLGSSQSWFDSWQNDISYVKESVPPNHESSDPWNSRISESRDKYKKIKPNTNSTHVFVRKRWKSLGPWASLSDSNNKSEKSKKIKYKDVKKT